MRMYDVIIIGGGIIGSSVAWQLARRKKKVLVIERKDVCSGSAGATDGVVGYHTKKPGLQLDLAVQSIEMFRTLNRDLETNVEYGFEAGGMQPVEDKDQWDMLASMAAEQRRSGVDIRMITAEEACSIEPNLNPDIYGALWSPTGGKVNPLAMTFGFARAAKRLGAVYLTETEVTHILTEGGRAVGVNTSAGEFRADCIVDAAGAWAGKVAALAGIDLPIRPRKGQLLITEPIGPFLRATVQCAMYNVIKFRPETIKDPAVLKLGSSLSIEQQESGGLIIGGTREFADFEEENTFEAVETMVKRAVRFFPALKDVSIIRCFSGFRPYTPDGLSMMGEVRTLPGFYMAAGHEGDGIALSPITGRLMAELITDGKTSYDITPFSPNRFLKGGIL
ncbi:MAG: FAD-binding oxidoreductase [Stomatobaculum sp.]|nr:FAD-binding oxidoreductase [Stomatobaculum sp.]